MAPILPDRRIRLSNRAAARMIAACGSPGSPAGGCPDGRPASAHPLIKWPPDRAAIVVSAGRAPLFSRAIMIDSVTRRRRLTGLKPTGHVHLGNLLGAIKPMVADQHDSESIVMIADLHAMTLEHDP